jgi:hypothetical protein
MLDTKDILWIIHPALAIAWVFPLIGIVVYKALQTRQRRLQVAVDKKSKIPPIVGNEHVQIGRWLSASVVGLCLIGIAHPIFTKMAAKQTWTAEPERFFFVLVMFALTIASLVLLFRAVPKHWRAVFATLTGMGVIVLGSQPEVYRRGELKDLLKPDVFREIIVSHYYYGIIATMLMIFSLAIIQDIYQDRSNRWRNVHIVLNSIATLLFITQGITGARDLLEIPLSWQDPYVQQLYANQCQTQPCKVEAASQTAPKP